MLRQSGAGSNPDISSDHNVGADGNGCAEPGPRADPGGGIDARALDARRKQSPDNVHQRLIGIGYDDSSGRATWASGQLFGDENSSGPGGAEIGGVSRGNSKGERVGTGPAQRPDRVDPHSPVTNQAATDEIGDRLRGKATSRHATSCPL